MKYTLRHQRLNSGGYTSTGYYFGNGQRLYWYCSDNQIHHGYLRAIDRKDAKRKIRSQYINQTVTFYN
jgi:ribosomal protein L20